MNGKEITIADIAERLGISYATVSRALTDHPRISKQTKKKVNDLAESLGYQPNHNARSLRLQKTKTLGVIVPRLNSLFMSAVIAGMEDTAQEHGYNLIISQSSELLEIEKQNVKTMFNSRVDGLMASVTYQTKDTEHFGLFFKRGIPVIFVDRCIGEEENFSVVIDNKRAGYQATKHLLEHGCRNILHITADSHVNVYKDRLAGFKEALSGYNLKFEPQNLLIADLSFESGEKAAQAILNMNPRPDGIFVANDNCAVGCMVALKEAGVKIPHEIAFVGFNNDLVSRVVEPRLSSINYPGYELGAITTRELINKLSGSETLQMADKIVVKSELVIRESSLKG